ncbi:type I restriction modification DNA specificity domain protein [Eubacterium brachy ATCC 33089]|nr:type I restriction modification DNA specificity domain protein [Eubacterium brachy ATCC 33089]
MSKNIKCAIPKWRFSEFRDSGEWEEKELNESLDYLQPTQYLVQSENYSDNYETPVLTAGKSFVLGYTNEKDGIFNNKLPVIIFDDFTTDSKFVDFPFKVKSSAIKILLAKYNYNIKFIFEIMQMVNYEVFVHKRHWISIFSKLKVLIPKLPEQQKIADCLSSIDDLISAEEKKALLLNNYKKGWMQKLFPAEGKTVPEWRFPEFRDSGDWEENIMDDIVICNNSTISLNKLELKQSGYPVYGADGVVGHIDNFQQSEKYISVVKDGSGVGRLNLNTSHSSVLGTLSCIKSKNKTKYLLEWIYYYLNSIDFSVYVKGSGIPHIYYSDYKNRIVSVPNLPEQQKIADFLSGIDELISRQKDKIEELKQHKKALMQGLFPVIEEVWK